MKIPNLSNIPGVSALFGNGNYVLSSNNKSHIVRIGNYTIPLQPLVEVRLNNRMVKTDVVGSASNTTLMGGSVKEDMGEGDAIITLSGIYMSTSKTLTQTIGLSSNPAAGLSWHDVFKEIIAMFKSGESLPIYDWIPGEEGDQLPEDYFDVYASNPEDPRVKDIGFSIFEEIGVTHVVMLSHNLAELPGTTRLPYTLRLEQDVPATLQEIMPLEEIGTEVGDTEA